MYTLGVSYASEDIEYVNQFVQTIKNNNISVFFDRDEYIRLISTYLHEELYNIFSAECEHCIIFLSKNYLRKSHTLWEMRTILNTSLEKKCYFSVANFDNSVFPGLPTDFFQIDITQYSPEKLATTMIKKLKYIHVLS